MQHISTLITETGDKTTILPENTKKGFTLEELYKHLECDTIEVVYLPDNMIFIVDEEGKLNNKIINKTATLLWWQLNPAVQGIDVLVGKVILTHSSLLK